MSDLAIREKVMHGAAQVEVVSLHSDDACYVQDANGTRYRVKKSALSKVEKPKKEK